MDCPQISRLKMEGNYWDDVVCRIKARAASRLWQRRIRGGHGWRQGEGHRMPAAPVCREMLLAASSSVLEDTLEADAPWPQLSRMPERVCSMMGQGG